MTQYYVFGGQANLITKSRSFDKIVFTDGFKKIQFHSNSIDSFSEERELAVPPEWGIQSSLSNDLGVDIVSASQTIREALIGPHWTAATAGTASKVVDATDLKRLLKCDGLIISGCIITTTLEVRADAFDNARDLSLDFQNTASPQYMSKLYTIYPATYSGTPKGVIKLRPATSGFSLGALRDAIEQSTAKTAMATTRYTYTEYWCPEDAQAANPDHHIFDPNVSDDLTENLGFYIPTIAGAGGVQLDQSVHFFDWGTTITLSEEGYASVRLDVNVYPTDNTLDA